MMPFPHWRRAYITAGGEGSANSTSGRVQDTVQELSKDGPAPQEIGEVTSIQTAPPGAALSGSADQAAPLDALLADATLGTFRFTRDTSAVKFAAALAPQAPHHRPRLSTLADEWELALHQHGACLPCSRLSGLMPSSASRGAARATAITSWVLATRVQTASPRRASTRLARTIPVNPQTGGGDPPYGDSGSPHWNAARREAGSDGRALAHKPGLPSSLELIFPSVAVGFALGPAVLGLHRLRSARESDSPVHCPRYLA